MADKLGLARFPPRGRADWEAAATRVLKGRSPSELERQSDDGLPLAALYLGDEPSSSLGQPDRFRYSEDGRIDLAPPRVTATIEGDNPSEINRILLRALERGLEAARIPIRGLGRPGAPITTLDDLDRALDGVPEHQTPLMLVGGDGGLAAGTLLVALWDRRGHTPETPDTCLGADPLGDLARQGRLPFEPSTLERHVVGWTMTARSAGENVRAFEIDTSPYHDAGATPVLELAYALASGVYLLRAMEGGGLAPEEGLRQLCFRFSVGCQQFEEIAKLRAFRRLWDRTLEGCGVAFERRRGVMHAVTSRRMMTQRDPWVNMLRTTVAAFAATVASVDALEVRPFDEARGIPDELGRRIAQNTHFILREESHAGRVADPAGGAWYVETHTENLARAAWDAFRHIEASGGMLEHLCSGRARDEVERHAKIRHRELATGVRSITGMSTFALLDEKPPPARSRAALAPEPEPEPEGGALRQLEVSSAKAAYAEGESYATVAAALRNGEVTAPGLTPRRDAEGYEALRNESDRLSALLKRRPRVLLVKLGPPGEHRERANWARDVFAAGGFEAVDEGPSADPTDAAESVRARDIDVAVLCGADARYAEHGAGFIDALRTAGARALFVAGQPVEHLDNLDAGFLARGSDILELLGRAYEALRRGRS